MDVQLYLVAPQEIETAPFAKTLGEVLQAAPVAALLLPRGDTDDAGYEARVSKLIPIAQKHGCAVLLENAPQLARKLGADGVHMTGGMKAVAEARTIVGPDLIVGAGDLNSRHDAMSKGESGIDYVMFGALSGPTDPEATANALWWAETFEVPCVLYAGGDFIDEMNKCEFAGVGGEAIWNAPEGPAQALSRTHRRLGVLV